MYIFFYRSCFWQISEVRKAGDGFFNLSVDVKKSYSRPSDGRNFGWVSLERERYDSWPKIFYNCVQTFHFYLHPQKTTGIQIFKFCSTLWKMKSEGLIFLSAPLKNLSEGSKFCCFFDDKIWTPLLKNLPSLEGVPQHTPPPHWTHPNCCDFLLIIFICLLLIKIPVSTAWILHGQEI